METVEKLIHYIKVELNVKRTKIAKINYSEQIKNLVPKLDIENISALTLEDLNELNDLLLPNLKLNETEYNFLEKIINMPAEFKQIKLKNIKFDNTQKKLIDGVKNKVKYFIDNYKVSSPDVISLQKEVSILNELMHKLNNPKLVLIDEIDLITEIMDKYNFDTDSRIEIFMKVNDMNIDIYNRLNADDYEIDEDEMEETNLDIESVIKLLKKYNINWIKNKTEFINQICKYGKLENIEEILEYLKIKKLDFVFEEKYEKALVKTLIYSKKYLIEQVLNLATLKGIDYIELVKKTPSILFPALKTHTYKGNGKEDNNDEKNLTGSLTFFEEYIDFFENVGIDINEVFIKCPSLFSNRTSMSIKIYNLLRTYGISFMNEDGTLKKGFSVLKSHNAISSLDLAIELDLLDYINSNLSILIGFTQDANGLKYLLSKNYEKEQLFYINNQTNKITSMRRKYFDGLISELTDRKIYQEYGYVSPSFLISKENYTLFNEITNNSFNENISEVALENSYIKLLDKNYKKSDIIYDFDGLIISRFKVIRYFETLLNSHGLIDEKDALIYSITKNGMYNQEEINKIQNSIEKLYGKGSK